MYNHVMENNYNAFLSGNGDNQYAELNPKLAQAGGLAYSASTIGFIAAGLLLGIIIAVCKIDAESDLYLYLNYLAAPVGMSAGIAFTLARRKISPKKVFPVKCHPKYFLIAVLLIYGLLFTLSWLDAIALEFFKALGYKERGASAYFPDMSGGKVVLALLVIAVCPAIFEEALFRGTILNTCENSLGTIRTMFVVGFCFSLFHASPEQTVYQFLAGCAFAFIALRSGSILPSVLMHFLNNALLVVFGAAGLYDEAGALVLSDTANVIIMITSCLCFAGAVIWLVLDKKPIKKCQKGAVKEFFKYASVGIAILGLSWLLTFFVSG